MGERGGDPGVETVLCEVPLVLNWALNSALVSWLWGRWKSVVGTGVR